MNKSGHHLGGSSTIFPIPIYTNGIDNFDAIQDEIDKAAEKVNFNMRPDWGHTHYLSDITFEENFIEKLKKVPTDDPDTIISWSEFNESKSSNNY